LVASAGTKSQPGGGAMAEVLERFVSSANEESRKRDRDVEDVIRDRLRDLVQFKGGHEFADVILAYWQGMRRHDDARREAALRWLRGEYRGVLEAKQALGVKAVIGDSDLYDMLRLMAMLISKAGYAGLVVQLDEVGVLARLQKRTRDQNYEQILTMINDLLSGKAAHLMVMFAGTKDFIFDTTRGAHSYLALRQRLTINEFQRVGLVDNNSPVMQLEQLTKEDLWMLLENIHRVYCSNNQRNPLPDAEAMRAFLDHAANQLGGLARVSPREASRSWIQFLDILDQNRHEDWRRLLGHVAVDDDEERNTAPDWIDEGFTALAAPPPADDDLPAYRT
jgi:hypothetical protein